MWFAALFNGKNGSMFRNVIYIGLIMTFLVILTIVIINKTKKNKIDKQNQQIIDQLESEIKIEKLSYPTSEYENMASKIYDSLGYFQNDDEEAVYGVFMRMKTNSDVIKLQEVFGTRASGNDLFSFITKHLNNTEIQKINTILAQRNITIKI